MPGRKSFLTDEQWAEIGARMLEGATVRELGRAYGVPESTIRTHFTRKGIVRPATIQQVAMMHYEADQALQALPLPAQVQAMTLAGRMRNIADQLGAAAEINAGTALHCASLANSEALKIDDADPSKTVKRRESMRELLKASNEAADLPRALVVAAVNRDAIKRLIDDQGPSNDDAVTPERLKEGVRRMAFLLAKADREDREETT